MKKHCSINGCKNYSFARGWCHMHYARWNRNGDVHYVAPRYKLPPRFVPLDKRLERHKKVDPSTGCWNWTGARNRRGYGVLMYRRKCHTVSRLSAHLYLGLDLNSELAACHRCDNPSCFNPKHLFIGTQVDNIRDMVAKGRNRSLKGSENGNAKLKDEEVLSIRKMREMGFGTPFLGILYGVHRSLILSIVQRRIWSHLTDSPCMLTRLLDLKMQGVLTEKRKAKESNFYEYRLLDTITE